MKKVNRMISLFLALLIVMGTVFTPSPANASGAIEDDFVEADHKIEDLNGESYKVYNFNDVMPTRPVTRLFRMAGDSIDAKYKVLLSWDAYDLHSEDMGNDLKITIYDKKSRKIIAETKPISAKPNTNVYYSFYETEDWSAEGVSHNSSDWQFRVPNDIRFDFRVRLTNYGNFADGNAEVSVIQYGSSIYRAEYFTNQTLNPTIMVQSNNNRDDRRILTINTENLESDQYYRFDSFGLTRRYINGAPINIIGDIGSEADFQLLVSDKGTAEAIKIYTKVPGSNDYDRQGSFVDTKNGDIPYYYLVTGDHKTPHIVTVREKLNVNFHPNGGEWKNVEEGVTKEAKSFPIGHSMYLGESWGDVTAIEVPSGDEITPPTVTGQDGLTKKNEFLGWSTEQSAEKAMTEEELAELQITEDTTLYAVYSELGNGKAKVKYYDNETGQEINLTEDLQIDNQVYPTEKEGSLDEPIPNDVFTKETAPKLRGYEYVRLDITPENSNFDKDASGTIKLLYKKVEDVVNGDDGQATRPDGYVTVNFDLDGKGTTSDETVFYVNPSKTVSITAPKVIANTGYTFTDWDKEVASSFTNDTTYTAQYTTTADVIPGNNGENERPAGYVTVRFELDGKGSTADETVYYVNPNATGLSEKITAPKVTGQSGYTFNKWDSEIQDSYKADTTHKALYEYKESIVPQKPGQGKPVVPEDYVKVEFLPDTHGTISNDQTTIFWVNPNESVDLTDSAPKVKADSDWKFTGWNIDLTQKFAESTDIIAAYKAKVVENDPDDEDYVKVEFVAEDHGSIAEDEQSVFWVFKGEKVNITEPKVNANDKYELKSWNPAIKEIYTEETTHKAVFSYNGDNAVAQDGENKPDVPSNFVKVEFKNSAGGSIDADQTTIYWVNPDKKVTLTVPKVTVTEGYKHIGWTYEDKSADAVTSITDTFNEETDITANYLKVKLDREPEEDVKDNYVNVKFLPGTNGKFTEMDPEQQTEFWVLKDTDVTIAEPQITANDGWKYVGWDNKIATSFSKDTQYTAQYKEITVTEDPKDPDYVKVSFNPGKQGTIKEGSNGEIWILKGETVDTESIKPELVIEDNNYAFARWNPEVQTTYDTDTTHTAQYTYNGDDVVAQEPGQNKPNVPDNFVRVEFEAGEQGSIANTETTVYWVNPEAKEAVTLTAPKLTAKADHKHIGWTYGDKRVTNTESVTDKFADATTITADYLLKVATDDPQDTENYVSVEFIADNQDPDRGTLTGTTKLWVLKDTLVDITAPEVNAEAGYRFTGWSPEVKNSYNANTTHTAQYEAKAAVVETDPQDDDYVKVTFNANGGYFGTDTAKTTRELWALKGTEFYKVSEIAGTPVQKGKTFENWMDQVTGGNEVDSNTKIENDLNVYASWTDKDIVKDVDDLGTDPEEGYVRLTFDPTNAGQINEGETGEKAAIDVLEGTAYNNTTLTDKIAGIKAVPTDITQAFDKWDPNIPATGTVTTQEFTATYTQKDKVVTEDPDDSAYVEITFDANEGVFADSETTKSVWVLKGVASFKDARADIEDPSRDGYNFTGWYDKAEEKVLDTKVLEEAETFYANYTKEKSIADYVGEVGLESVDFGVWKDAVITDNFWKQGVKLARADAKLQDYLDKATVTDLGENGTLVDPASPRTAEEVGDFTGNLRVEFTDGSELLVEDQVLTVWNNKTEITDDNKATPRPEDAFEVMFKVGEGVKGQGKDTILSTILVRENTELEDDDFPILEPAEGYKDVSWTPTDRTITEDTKFIANGEQVIVDQITVTVEKSWDNAEDLEKPEVSFELWRKLDGSQEETKVAEAKVLEDDKVVFENQDKTDINENEYTYYVKEVFRNTAEADNWTIKQDTEIAQDGSQKIEVTNTLKDKKEAKGELTLKAVLEPEPIDKSLLRLAQPKRLQFTFKVTGPYGYEETFELAAGEEKVLENLYYGEYTVQEINTFGYTVDYSPSDRVVVSNTNSAKEIIITNRNVRDENNPSILSITIEKVWEGVDPAQTPGTTIELWRRNNVEGTNSIDEKVGETFEIGTGATEGALKKVFEDLPKHDVKGYEYEYYVKEESIDGFETEIMETKDGFISKSTFMASEEDVIPSTGNDKPNGYVTVMFDLDGKGTTSNETTFYVNPKATVNLTAFEPTVYANIGYEFTEWDTDLTGTFGDDTTITAQYNKLADIITEGGQPNGYVTISFVTNMHASLDGNTIYYVNPEAGIKNRQLTEPTINPAEGYKLDDPNWNPIFDPEATITEDQIYVANISQMEPEEPDTFEITYVSGHPDWGSVDPESEIISVDENLETGKIQGSTAIANEGYKFVKWTNAKGEFVSDVEHFTPIAREAATYVAVFEAIEEPEPTDFTINYYSVNNSMGTVSPESETVRLDGGIIQGSTATPKEGYKFVRWTDKNGRQVSTRAKFVPTARVDSTYTAIFEKIEKPTPNPKPEKPGGDGGFTPGWTPKPEDPEVIVKYKHFAYIKGYPDGTVRPDRQITRAEAAAIIARLEGLDMSNSTRPNFTDIKSGWYNGAINAVTAKGLMQGYPDGSFRANSPITRAEFAQLIKLINKKAIVNKGLPFVDVKGHWGYEAMTRPMELT